MPIELQNNEESGIGNLKQEIERYKKENLTDDLKKALEELKRVDELIVYLNEDQYKLFEWALLNFNAEIVNWLFGNMPGQYHFSMPKDEYLESFFQEAVNLPNEKYLVASGNIQKILTALHKLDNANDPENEKLLSKLENFSKENRSTSNSAFIADIKTVKNSPSNADYTESSDKETDKTSFYTSLFKNMSGTDEEDSEEEREEPSPR